MPFQTCPNIVEVSLRMLQNGQHIENVLHFKKTGAGYIASDIAAIAAEVEDWWAENYSFNISSAVEFVQVYAKGLTSASDLEAVVTSSFVDVGQLGAAALPNSVALCVSLLTGLTGRSRRGRIYVPGLIEGEVVGNTVDSTRVSSIIAGLETLIARAAGIDFEWVVLSRIAGGVLRAAGIGTPITTVDVFDAMIDSQRRRLPGRGR